MKPLNTSVVDFTWHDIFHAALACVKKDYLNSLQENSQWLPGPEKIFNAFSLPLPRVNYILFGESPYPRAASANGYAFWDAAVQELWSPQGLAKTVNRATSLRNIIKMLLIARGDLSAQDLSQTKIASLDKKNLVSTGEQFFQSFLHHGILLLNASLVLSQNAVRVDAQAWLIFIEKILQELAKRNTKITLLLFGKIAALIDSLPAAQSFQRIYAEHPYNISFITNKKMIDFFAPLDLLKKIK